MSMSSVEAVETVAPRSHCGSRLGRMWRRGALIGATALLTVDAAIAQIGRGYSGRSDGEIEYVDNEEAMRILSAFGNCYAQHSTTRALELIGTDPGSREEAETYRRLFRTQNLNCLGEATELTMPVAYVRGAIAEGLLERNTVLPANLVRAAPAPGVEVRKLSEAARCYAVGHGAQIRAMLATPASGERQMAALRPMVDGFFNCLPASARNRRLDATQLRYVLAEALLRLPATAPAGAR